ncbi:hypothetical protein M3Y99_01081600 [Aphelenchoides fujianensis]|nr:hypothetical protein M3Y99_01081600 [Aphelenchoides fujianensis]
MQTAISVLLVFYSFGRATGVGSGRDDFAAARTASIAAFNADPTIPTGDGRETFITAHSLVSSLASHFHSTKAVIQEPDRPLVHDGRSFLLVHSNRPLPPLVCRMPLGFLRKAVQLAANSTTKVNSTESSGVDEFLA